jgi:hypothetical protein
MDKMFVNDPALGELVKELRAAIDSGRMRTQDAMEALKAAIKKSIEEKAQIIKDVMSN